MVTQVIVASGIEIRDALQGVSLLRYLNDNADFDKRSGRWTFPKGAGAKARLQVSVVYTAGELATALDTADAYVVYSGHSRYGQGPAFGPARTPHVPDKGAFPVNPWGVHFRMGYDATDTEAIGDLTKHSVSPPEYDLTSLPAKPFLPEALVSAAARVQDMESKRRRGKLTKAQVKSPCTVPGSWRAFNACWAKLAKTPTARGDTPLAGRHYYAHRPHYEPTKADPKGRDEFFVSVAVGSTDLDASTLKCKLFFMASCSSHEHFYQPLARRRRAVISLLLVGLSAARNTTCWWQVPARPFPRMLTDRACAWGRRSCVRGRKELAVLSTERTSVVVRKSTRRYHSPTHWSDLGSRRSVGAKMNHGAHGMSGSQRN